MPGLAVSDGRLRDVGSGAAREACLCEFGFFVGALRWTAACVPVRCCLGVTGGRATPCDVPRMWRNWQTRWFQVPVGVTP